MLNIRLQRSGSLLRILLVAAVGVSLGCGLLVWTRTQITSLRYQLTQLLDRESQLRSDIEKLQVEAAVLSAPDRIEREALFLGLRYPKAGQLVRVHTTDAAGGGPE